MPQKRHTGSSNRDHAREPHGGSRDIHSQSNPATGQDYAPGPEDLVAQHDSSALPSGTVMPYGSEGTGYYQQPHSDWYMPTSSAGFGAEAYQGSGAAAYGYQDYNVPQQGEAYGSAGQSAQQSQTLPALPDTDVTYQWIGSQRFDCRAALLQHANVEGARAYFGEFRETMKDEEAYPSLFDAHVKEVWLELQPSLNHFSAWAGGQDHLQLEWSARFGLLEGTMQRSITYTVKLSKDFEQELDSRDFERFLPGTPTRDLYPLDDLPQSRHSRPLERRHRSKHSDKKRGE